MLGGSIQRTRLFVSFAALFLSLLLLPRIAAANEPIVLRDADERHAIGESLDVLFDPGGRLDFSEAASAAREPDFQRATHLHPNFGFTQAAVWLRFTLSNESGQALEEVLEVGREWIEEIDLHSTSVHVRSGARLPLALRPIQSERLVVPIALTRGETATFFVRLRSNSSIGVVGALEPRQRFFIEDARANLFFGGFYAVLFAMAAYNFLLYLVLRERVQGWLALTLVAYALGEACSHGQASRFLPAGAGWLEVSGGALCFGAYALAMIEFSRQALGTPLNAPRLDNLLRALGPLAALGSVVAAIEPSLDVFAWAMLGTIIVPLLVTSIVCAKAGSRIALSFAIAFCVFLVPLTPTFMMILGLVPIVPAIDQWQHAGAVVMTCLFSLSIAEGIRDSRERLRSMGGETERLNTQLEIRVDELVDRNREVQSLNEELRHQVVSRSRELADVLALKGVTVSAPVVSPGDVLDQRYRVVSRLGEGAMGAVFEVERTSDNRRLALKVLTSAMSGAAAARFAREAEIGATVRHPNVVAIQDVGVLPTGAPFLAMELVHGGALEDSASRFGDVGWAIELLAGIAEGLAALHAAGIVHRDLKPANVLLARDGERFVPKIADFGISRVGASEDDADPHAETIEKSTPNRSHRRLTAPGAILGTPLYMAPEAADGAAAIGPPADVFGFGVMAFEMITGAAPFATPPILLAMAHVPLPSPPSIEGALDDELAKVLSSCVAEAPSARPSAASIAFALRIAWDALPRAGSA